MLSSGLFVLQDVSNERLIFIQVRASEWKASTKRACLPTNAWELVQDTNLQDWQHSAKAGQTKIHQPDV